MSRTVYAALFRRRSVALLRLRLLLPFANAIVLRLNHSVELTLLLVTGQRCADLIDRRLPELVNFLQLRIARQ